MFFWRWWLWVMMQVHRGSWGSMNLTWKRTLLTLNKEALCHGSWKYKKSGRVKDPFDWWLKTKNQFAKGIIGEKQRKFEKISGWRRWPQRSLSEPARAVNSAVFYPQETDGDTSEMSTEGIKEICGSDEFSLLYSPSFLYNQTLPVKLLYLFRIIC